ncbi:MAG TPA: DnaJ C-terminal domain-containing protein [Woeseiaceae bacterium]|nr:DnaJ C-terminal domain-containing protein [Woeseiaceae bacterium]
MKFKDYYEVLGVKRSASQDDIKRAYRRLARKYHPDVSKEPDAEARFKEMREAYAVLKDPEKRSAYDQFGENWKAGQDFQPPPDWGSKGERSSGGRAYGGAGDFSDFFETLFGQGGRGGFRYEAGGGRMRGEDASATISIPIEDAFRGATRTVSLEVPEIDSSGRLSRRRRTLNVKIPKGVTAGKRIRLENQGGPGMAGGAAGDLYLTVEFEPHPLYRAEGKDLYLELPVTPWEVALGRKVKVPTLAGTVDLKIPAGSGSGKTLRLKGRGLPGEPAGDQYVELKVVVPPAADAGARELYEKLEQEHDVNPRAKLGV